MSLLMPEYERQLRAAARRLAGNPAAVSATPSHGGLGARLFLVLTRPSRSPLRWRWPGSC